jgi:hypothetical protein
MIRAIRLMARLGWQMDERTRARYETGKEEGYISAMSDWQRSYETEEIFHEEDPLRVISKLEAEGWLKQLHPALGTNKANAGELERLRDTQMQLQIHGIHAEAATANFPLLVARLVPKDGIALKKSFVRQGFVREIEALESEGKAFAAQFSSKEAALPSQAWKLLHSARPEAVLWAAHHMKTAAVQNKLKAFYTEWPQARQKIPFPLMQEMRITPDLPGYEELVEKLFFELMDNHLATVEEQKAFLEPYSPPAPPPPVNLRRARATRKEPKAGKGRKKIEAGEEATAAASTETVESGTKKAAEPGKKTAGKVPAPVKKAAAPSSAKPAAKKVSAPAKKAPAKVQAPIKKALTKKAAPLSKKASAKPAPAKKAVAAKKALSVKKPAGSKKITKAPVKKKGAVKKAPKPAKKKR